MTMGTNQSEINIANTHTSLVDKINLDKFNNPSRMHDE